MSQTPASPPPPPGPQPYYGPPQGATGPPKTISILAVVFGAAALLFGLIPVAGIFIGGLFGLAAIVLGVIGILKSHRLMAIIGIALAVLGLIIATIISVQVGKAVEQAVEDWPTDWESTTDREDTTDEETGGLDDFDGVAGTDPNSPLPAGTEVETGNWRVSFSDVVPDASETVLDENEFNEPPAEGHQFFMYRVDATYIGGDSSFAWDDLQLGVAFGNTLYTDYCGVIPDDLAEAPEVFKDGTVSGNNCVMVPSDGVEDAVISVQDHWQSGERYFVSTG
ncbi:hypothetical protein L0U85_10060 [Glycomyces sp. L485]|uniref:hypothetical protein n=1 Tax=Glycomyces sp. L485 TaxID=2909235 RepID=UPI001F4A25BE|nr:hypothetical protein [Glycomyces sp. L485]MCH7231192.1 hypothetical protein [Glycomyces sp. L485]